jgi:acyl-CoA thioesterase
MAPSIDLSCAFHRARATEPWLYAQARADSAANGLIGCNAHVWARDGALLAVGASQLLCRPAPTS